jgi:hypothetical protein
MLQAAVTAGVVALTLTTLALASGSPVITPSVGQGVTTVGRCDTNGLTVSYTTSGGNTTVATVSGIADPGCEGLNAWITVVNATGAAVASSGPQPVPTDGGTADNTVAFSLSPTPMAELVAGASVVIRSGT